jgi:hypothetical protein
MGVDGLGSRLGWMQWVTNDLEGNDGKLKS